MDHLGWYETLLSLALQATHSSSTSRIVSDTTTYEAHIFRGRGDEREGGYSQRRQVDRAKLPTSPRMSFFPSPLLLPSASLYPLSTPAHHPADLPAARMTRHAAHRSDRWRTRKGPQTTPTAARCHAEYEVRRMSYSRTLLLTRPLFAILRRLMLLSLQSCSAA